MTKQNKQKLHELKAEAFDIIQERAKQNDIWIKRLNEIGNQLDKLEKEK
jgi:hypothetical protein